VTNGADEKRRAQRVAYPCEVRYSSGAADWQSARLSDISVDGAFVDTMIELPVGTKLLLAFEIEGTQVEIPTVVAHSMPQFGMGVRFLSLDPAARAAIEKYIRSQGG
jgi:hypothetical protein